MSSFKTVHLHIKLSKLNNLKLNSKYTNITINDIDFHKQINTRLISCAPINNHGKIKVFLSTQLYYQSSTLTL